MKKQGKFFIALWLAALILTGCNAVFTTPISKILQNPREYEGKEVAVSGTVVQSFGLVFLRYFIVRDKTGEITVVTNRALPREGEKIKVRGQVAQAFAIGDKQLVVILEDSGRK